MRKLLFKILAWSIPHLISPLSILIRHEVSKHIDYWEKLAGETKNCWDDNFIKLVRKITKLEEKNNE